MLVVLPWESYIISAGNFVEFNGILKMLLDFFYLSVAEFVWDFVYLPELSEGFVEVIVSCGLCTHQLTECCQSSFCTGFVGGYRS